MISSDSLRLIHQLADLARSNSDLESIRSQYLSLISDFCGASSATLVLPGNNHQKVNRFLQSVESVSVGRKEVLLKFVLPDSRPAVIVFSVNAPPPGNSEAVLSAIASVLSLLEEKHALQQNIQSSQQLLRALSEKSAALAKNNAHLFQEFSSNQNRLLSISKGILRTQEEERSKISRELHDGLGQALTALKINLEFLSAQEKALALDSRKRLEEIKALADQSLEDVRELSRLLRPRILDDLGLYPTLRWYVRKFQKRTGIRISLAIARNGRRLDSEMETVLFRVTQEALNNIAKHSKAPAASIRLTSARDSVRLEIADRGIGFQAGNALTSVPQSGSGLSGMRDRVSLWGGTLSVQSKPGQGTSLEVTIPLKQSAKKRKMKHG